MTQSKTLLRDSRLNTIMYKYHLQTVTTRAIRHKENLKKNFKQPNFDYKNAKNGQVTLWRNSPHKHRSTVYNWRTCLSWTCNGVIKLSKQLYEKTDITVSHHIQRTKHGPRWGFNAQNLLIMHTCTCACMYELPFIGHSFVSVQKWRGRRAVQNSCSLV